MPNEKAIAAHIAQHEVGPHSIAYAAGFERWHSGGGCMSFRRDVAGKHWLITDADEGIDGDPEAPIWEVGVYDSGDEDEAMLRWAHVREPVTLAQAIELHARLPEPMQIEQSFDTWADLGIEIGRDLPTLR